MAGRRWRSPRGQVPRRVAAFHEHELDGHVYVVPADVAALVPGRLDWSLFDVTLLAEMGLDDASTDSLPVVVEPATDSVGAVALPGGGDVVRRRERPCRKSDAAALGAALATAATDGRRAGARRCRSDPPGRCGAGDQWTVDSGWVTERRGDGHADCGRDRPRRPSGRRHQLGRRDQRRRPVAVPPDRRDVRAVARRRSTCRPVNYAVLGYLFTYDEPSVYAYEGVATFEPEVLVESAPRRSRSTPRTPRRSRSRSPTRLSRPRRP